MEQVGNCQRLKAGDTKIIIGFGEEVGTGDIEETINPMIDGLTTGTPTYKGIFILRNPENSNIINYSLNEIPIYMEKKLKNNYEISMCFKELPKRDNIKEFAENGVTKIDDIEITSFILDPSNFNTHILRIKDNFRKICCCQW